MRIAVQDLGPLAAASFELAPLTVITGPNNTGKSWLANAIYSAGRRLSIEGRMEGFAFQGPGERISSPALSAAVQAAKAALDARDGAEHKLTLERSAVGAVGSDGAPTATAGTLARWLGVPDQLPPRAALRWTTGPEDPPLFERANGTIRRVAGRLELSGALEGPAFDPMPISATFARHEASNAVLQLAGWLRDCWFRRAVAFPEERLGVAEQNAERNREGAQERPFLSEAARDLARMLGELRGYGKETRGALGGDEEASARLAALLGGHVEMDTGGALSFRFGITALPLPAAGAGVRALALFALYLRHLASPGDLIVLDAPELGLDARARGELAALLRELPDRGYLVVVATREQDVVEALAGGGAALLRLGGRGGGAT